VNAPAQRSQWRFVKTEDSPRTRTNRSDDEIVIVRLHQQNDGQMGGFGANPSNQGETRIVALRGIQQADTEGSCAQFMNDRSGFRFACRHPELRAATQSTHEKL
jgi:hypothetical protein